MYENDKVDYINCGWKEDQKRKKEMVRGDEDSSMSICEKN